VKDFLPKRLGLSKLRMRAGSMFVYGPWILHLDGLHIAYEGPTLTAALYGGGRHTDYTRDQSTSRPGVGGASLRIDLRGITNAVPIAISGEYLGLTKSEETGQEQVDTALAQVDWRPRQDVVVTGSSAASTARWPTSVPSCARATSRSPLRVRRDAGSPPTGAGTCASRPATRQPSPPLSDSGRCCCRTSARAGMLIGEHRLLARVARAIC
jgi:hypothetical protein